MQQIIMCNREQFFKMFPPETRNITVNNEVVCNLGHEVICDHCNGDVFSEENENAFLLSYKENPMTTDDISDVICVDCALKLQKDGN